ncbi:aldehyde dehydrogenase family protein [Zafaria sp. Z1313]|uniref:aldehyde dehydrogenase family protein n=1 Tax=unclassified Zafaria TaxID=2828765 RepID=UPI002E75E7E4|nr:aldehyde dehydrogenase family protein [Zafaria sp. J156]MEE1621428.1 aldehyde dehydrogenase family protein [Zafaria sp. J156]
MGLFSRGKPRPPADVAPDQEQDDAGRGAEAGAPHVPGVAETVARLRDSSHSRLMHTRRHRAAQLRSLERMLEAHEEDILAALAEDLGKPAIEAKLTELDLLRSEIDHAQLYLTEWMAARHVRAPLSMQPATAKVEPQPKGLVLILGPWNYPLQLLLCPMVAALAAGNCVVLKPSEQAPATSALMARLIPLFLDPRAVAVVEGGAEASQALLAEPWDHIFYTGGERVGKIVARAAAEHLTPVTLELGGKSPAVVVDGNVPAIARRIAFGKFMNAGQTCIAPDYVLAVGPAADALEKQLAKAVTSFYGRNPAKSSDYGRIVNDAAFRRLNRFLDDAHADPGTTVTGGTVDPIERYIEPTLLTGVPADAPVMQEEIFGPILPILRVDSFDAAVRFVNSRPTPLAAYLFSEKPRLQTAFEDQVRAGAIGLNVCNLHAGVLGLPFGGAGASGMGNYRGRYGFETFSQQRPVLSKTAMVDTLKAVYPPHGWAKSKLLRDLL